MRLLYKSTTNRKVSGLLGGLAEYMNIDPTILRVIFIFLMIFTGVFPGVIAYLIAGAIVPYPPGTEPKSDTPPSTSQSTPPTSDTKPL